MCPQCILAGACEGFAFQVPLDPFEEQLNQPTGPADVRNGFGRELDVFCKKDIMFASFRISDYQFYLEKLSDACQKHDCDVHAYVLMINYNYRRTGTLWDRF